MGWTRICCAVDFSETSRFAMLEAAGLARRFDAELTLLHVHEPSPMVATDLLVSPEGVAEGAGAEVEQMLAGWGSDAERCAGKHVATVLRVGFPAVEILRHARERECDLIVMGTHGRKGLGRLVLGSAAEHVVRQAACSVLVVRPPAKAGSPGTTGGTS